MPNSNRHFPDHAGRRTWLWGIAGIGIFLLVWQLGAAAVGSHLILPTPAAMLRAWLGLVGTARFWTAVGGSFLRVLEAFLISSVLGMITGTLSAWDSRVESLLAPLMTGIRATPVLALILLAMFWFPASQVPVFSAVLMGFPVMHTSTYAGIRARDPRLLEMSRLFAVPRRTRLLSLDLPSAWPYILSGASNILGLSWKVVVAGEVLSQPSGALGSGMQEARLMLETPFVFAWAATTITLCGISEFILHSASKAAWRAIGSVQHQTGV
ncbi:MAG: ABC transporter permease subunit [Spirochaetaceae bacterium]|nr:ABC transporter permease subunit [Spirochaetaceae bacterium]